MPPAPGLHNCVCMHARRLYRRNGSLPPPAGWFRRIYEFSIYLPREPPRYPSCERKRGTPALRRGFDEIRERIQSEAVTANPPIGLLAERPLTVAKYARTFLSPPESSREDKFFLPFPLPGEHDISRGTPSIDAAWFVRAEETGGKSLAQRHNLLRSIRLFTRMKMRTR